MDDAISERAASARKPPVKVAVWVEDPAMDGARNEATAVKK
jgi:hypothetical protein